MTITATTTPPAQATRTASVRTARTTGLLYLGLAITGMLGTLVVRNQLFVTADPAATLSNLTQHESLARLGVALEMGIVITQALAALWFYRLFRSVDTFAASAIAAFGMINATAILVSAALLATALEVSQDPAMAQSAAASVQVLYVLAANVWMVSGIFFGLWLIPMGWLVRRSGWMPSLLGWTLTIGGVGYVASAFVSYLVPGAGATTGLLTMPATVGELWMVGYLCLVGVRRA